MRRLAERDAERERARRKASRPAWQDPTALTTAAALVVGLVLVVLFVLRPGSGPSAPSSSANPLGLVQPSIAIPSGLADGRALGKTSAPVTMDVWTDFQCPFCDQFVQTVEPKVITDFVAKGTVRLVAHDFTFLGSGQTPDESLDAAVAARCADRQGHFWEFYETLFSNQGLTENSGAFSRARLLAMADLLGLDHAAFQTCLADTSVGSAVLAEKIQGDAAGVSGTPTSFINGRPVVGLKDYATIAGLIVSAVPTPGGASPSAGGSAAP